MPRCCPARGHRHLRTCTRSPSQLPGIWVDHCWGVLYLAVICWKRGGNCLWGDQDGWDQDAAKYMTPTVICPILPEVPGFYSGNCGAENRCLGNECSLSAPFSRLNYSNPSSSFPYAVSARISLICAHGGLVALSPPSGAQRQERRPRLSLAESALRPRGSVWRVHVSGCIQATVLRQNTLIAWPGRDTRSCTVCGRLKSTGPSVGSGSQGAE